MEKLDLNLIAVDLNSLQSPAIKDSCSSIDLTNILHAKFLSYTSSVSSGLDTTSTRSEEEIKSVFSLEQQIKLTLVGEEKTKEDKLAKDMTLSDIISKKKRTDTVKKNKKRCAQLDNPSPVKKVKKSPVKPKDDNLNVKKEIVCDNLSLRSCSGPPKIILVNGKPQLDTSSMEMSIQCKKRTRVSD